MPSLKLAEAWKDFTPPSPPDVSGKKAGGNTVSAVAERNDQGGPAVKGAPDAIGPLLSSDSRTSFFLSPDTEGLLEPGNIDLRRRPVVRNQDGSVSMARSFSIAKDGREYLLPTVSDEGRQLSDQEAIARFEETGRHLGAFKTAQDAAVYADKLDRQQKILYSAHPEEFQGVEIQQSSLVAGVPARLPGQAATPLSPMRSRSLFDRPLKSSSLISSSARTAPAYRPDPQRMEELHALILHDKKDPELEALLERNPAYRSQAALDDGSMPARALLGQQVLREVAGEKYANEPGFYFLALKENLPPAATRQEAYAAVYDHYRKAVEKQYEENKSRRAAYQKNRAQVDEAVAHVVGGLWSPAELGVRLTPEQTDVYLKEFDTGAVEKAHAAFSLLKQAFSVTPEEGLRRMVSEQTAMQITSALSDDDGAGKLTINETAFDLFEGSLHKLMGSVKEQSGDEWKFMHNLRVALFNPVVKRDATLATGLQLSGQQNLLVPFAKGHNTQVFDLMEETVREYQSYIKNDRENARVLGLLSTGQDLGNQSNERASFATRTVNCLGSVTGQTGSFFIPYVGWGIALAGAYDDKRNRAYYEGLEPGTAEWSAFVDAAASVAVEKISYGALGRLSGAGWVMGKLPFMAKARKTLTDSLWKHVLFETGAGVVEESFVEPTAEAIIQWAVRSNIAPLAGVDVGGGYDWNNYWKELKGMLEPDQLLATALFVGGLAGGTAGANSLIMQRSLMVHSRSPEMLMTQGIPEAEAKRISGIADNKERVTAVRDAVNKLKALSPEEVRKNAEVGVKAFRSLAEVRATVESEAYKFFQKDMRLPLVEEKLDKPGMYNLTVFDVDSGQKKFTQEMTEGQLISLFGNYFKEETRTQIAEAQSAFSANAFLRAAEKRNIVQSQDMLQWGKKTEEGQGMEEGKATEKGQGSGVGTGGNEIEEGSPAGETERELSTETDRPGSPVPATPARKTREKADSSGSLKEFSGSLEDGASVSGNDSAMSEGMSTLGKFVRTVGGMSQTGFSYLTRIALDEWNRRLVSGMSEEQAAVSPFDSLSPYAPLRSFLGLEKAFHERLKIAAKTTGEKEAMQTNLFQMGTAPGTSPADILFLVSKGLVGTREMLEDLFEVGIKNLVKGDKARLEAMGGLLRETQAGLQKLGFRGQFISPTGPLDKMKVVEAMSKLALSDTLANAESLPLPQWQKDLLQYHVNYLKDASFLLDLGRAWNLGRQKGTITQDMGDILRDLGHQVHTMYDQARIEQQDIQAVMEARAIVFGKGGPGSSAGGPTASQIRERQQRDAEEEKAHVTTGDKSKERTVPKEALQHPETVALPEAPESMQGVFVNGAAYNPDAGTWIGMVPVDKLHLSPEVPQVKVNSGKKGVVNPLVGDYRADSPPIYVWKRKDGRLEVVSGRHRLDLAQRTGTKAIAAYVYEEDADHDARWARLLDYEQNMQDDQADELTAAIYVRETGLSDDELTRRGLTRAGTKSRRGLLIGREAREDLWTRFRSGAIKAQEAEAICLLTQHIQDKARIDAMQMTAANDLAAGKSLEFVAAKIQLMAHASADGGMVQGLISFGESFEQDMERAAEYVARCISVINEHIAAIKGVRSISRKGNVLITEGITAGLSSDPAERLKELELLKAMYEKIGLYENLRVRALTWDGRTAPDPIGDHRMDMQAERARAEADAAALEDEENRKVAEKLTPEFSFSFSPSSRVDSVFPFLWRQAEKELNDRGNVSFALNGTRVSIHSLSEKNFREALETGGVLPPVNQGEDFSSGSVNAGEIACVLHPESVDGSGKRVPLSDFSGFIIPSSQENSLDAALMELGVPVRVYHVTEEETAFLEDPRNMKKEGVERDRVERNGLRRRELEVRRNNVIRSFLEETDVSFSLSPEERRIFTRARREDTWMKAPDGTPTALTERQWLQVHSDAFKEWFGESKIVNEHGEPVVVYHGTARADRVGTVFRGDRATSGPMAFFTDHENIAANYARDKGDTSIAYEEEDYYDYHQQFRITLPSGKDISLERYWHYLSPAEQRRITTLAGQIREDWDGDNSIIVDPSINDANGGFPYHLQEARGNAFRALVIQWLESAILLDEEHRFLDVLEKLDLPLSPYYRDPDYREPKVYACYMRMEHPFRTARITKKIISSLKAASKKAEMARESWRTDLWDKNIVSPGDWIERLEGDYENKTTRAWTSIPDWVTACLRKNGYDGIIDQGGKFHAEDHIVCIPFDSGQIKSATDNRGTFDPGSPDITFSLWNSKFIERAIAPLSEEERLILRRARDGGNYMLAPNGQPSRLTEKQWAQSRTKAFLDWYGDWLHDPANASKTLDENGEPIVLYHGGSFDIRRSPSVFDGVPHVDGIFFSDSTELSKSYQAYQGGSITTAWLNLKNPFPAQNEAGSRLPWVDRYIDYWQKEEGWTDRYTGEAMDREAVRDMIREGALYNYDMGERWQDFLGWVRQHHDGYLGHDPTDMGALIAVAFQSGQIKSSEYNSGAFSESDPDITFSLSNLAAVHSLEAEKLAAADKLGGLPLPSLAVTRLDRPYTWGGDENVYLVGSPALADPARGVEIYDRDMWSGHFPELRWNRREEKEREDFYRKAEDAALRYYGGTDVPPLHFLKKALDGDHRGELENKLRHSDLSLAVFAAELGYAPRPLMQKISGRLHTGDRLFHREMLRMVPWKDATLLSPDRQDEFCSAMERAIERYRIQFDQDSREGNLTVPQSLTRKSNLREMEKELKEAREDHFDGISHLALIDASLSGKTVPDWEANFKRFERYAAKHKKAFDAWVNGKMDRWLNPVPRIRETGFPATLNNITRYMLGSKGNGQEQGGIFSTGLLRAKQSRRFHSLEQIRENRDILVTSGEYEASQEEAQGLIHQFQEALYRIVNDFSAFNKAVEALSLIEGEPTPSKVLSALSRLYRGSLYRSRMARNSGNLLGLGAAAVHAMKSELRDYYEAVPQRAVPLEEFSHAVMPASLRKNKQIRDILKRHGIRSLYHDGTLEGRTRAMASLMGSAASFSLTAGKVSEGTSEEASDSSSYPSRFQFPTSDFMASLSEEERAITEKALASGTWMKAPNGEGSRLTPRQWVQVRTAAFRDWFGDWLDDPGHASRVVDENGEPRAVCHGTPVPYDSRYGWVDAVTYRHMPAPFSVFGEGNWHGAKFFFDDYERASSFASSKGLAMDMGEDAYTFECFLNARKLFYIKDKEAVSLVIDSFPDSVPVVHPQMGIVEHVSREAVAGLVNTSQSWILAETKEFQQKLQELGYDGFVAADRGDYYTAVFKSSQIKSATENVGSFDSSSPDITFSVIGPNAATWKRYQKNAFSGRDDGMQRAEIDASQAVLKDRSAPYLEPLRRELTAVRQSLSGETKKKIGRFLSLHWKFYRNKKGIEAEDHPDLWREYLSLDREREEWNKLLTDALLRTGLYHSRPAGAAVQAEQIPFLKLLLRADEDQIQALATLATENTHMTLEEWLEYPELFTAYPQLRSMPVIPDFFRGYQGLYSPAERSIYLHRNMGDPKQIRSILLHEVQHAIQHIEGFAHGGTTEWAMRFYESKKKDAREAYDQSSRFMSWLNARDGMISMLEYMLSLASNPRRVLRSSYLYSYDNVLRRLEGEERILDMARYALEDTSGILEQFYQEDWNRDAQFDLPWPGDYALNTPYGIKECLKAARATPSRWQAYRNIPKPDMAALYRNLLKYEKLSQLSPHQLYSRLAGEIESRNVEHRKDWTVEHRAAEPFNDTLEYPGEALVSFSLGDGFSSSPEPHSLQDGSPLPGALPLQDTSTLQGISQKVLKDASQDSLQNEYETEQSIHASSGPASFTERFLLSRSGEGDPGRGHSDEPAAGESHGADEGLQAGDNQAGSALSGGGPRRETDAAHSGQFDPAVGVLGVKAYSLFSHLAELAYLHDVYTGEIVELEPSAEGAAHFRRCLEEAKSSQVPYGECVYTYGAEEYEHMRLFLLPSGKAGFALKDGDMVSVFSHKQHGCEGRPSHTVIALAVQMGASKCDCYGTILPNLYAKFGFRAVARDRFNAEFSPESMQEPGHMERWYGKQDGKPDVVYMVYEGNRERVMEEFNPEAKSSFKSLPYSDFDACLEIQSRAVEAQRNREVEASGLSFGGDDSFPLPDSAADSVSFSVSPSETYKDGDGKIIRHKSVAPKTEDALLKRASLKEGEFCRVERVFRKSGSFEFSSRNKVESTADIAYIFRQLENASVENVFAVYIKDGQPIVQHISMGGIDSSIVECGGIIAAMGRLKPEAFYLVHNHPSGSLNASPEDVNIHQRLRRMFGDVVQEGIIIDTTSGYFAVFDSASPRKRSPSPMPGPPDKEQPVFLYAFDRAVFSPDWNPSKIARISGPKDIAAFISGHRLGHRKKISLLIFNNQLQIVANIHTRYSSLSSPELAKHIAECTAVYGGWHVAVYGDFIDQAAAALSVSAQEGFSELKSRLQAFHESVNLVDAIQVHGNHYSSLVSSYSSHVVDGERDFSSFSLTSLQKVVSSLTAPSMQATRAAELVKDCDKAAENWRRIMSGKAERPSARVGAELFGMVGSFLSAARYVLPEGYRSNVDMQMQWASVYAAMAESGEIPPKGTLRSGEAIYKKFEESMINNTTAAANVEEVRDILAAIGSQRLDRVMSKVLDRVRGQLIRYAKDELYLKTMKRVEAIYPKKEIGRKSPRGRLEAQAYRAVARYREMLGATAEAKAEAMETLEAKYNTEEDEEKRQEHEEDIIAWKTYGDYAGMSLPQAQAAMEKLLEFVMAGRNSWADKLRKEGGRNKYAARQIQKNLPVVNSASSRAGSKITHRTKLRKLLASLPYSFMSYAQLMLALEPILGQRFSRARIKEISEANAALLNASNDRSAWLFDTICRIAGVKSESAAEQWLVKFNTPEKTDIPIAPVIVLKVVLSIDDAREWLSLSREERDARRKEIREEERRTETVTENVPEEEDILLLRQALDEYEEKSPEQQQYQKNVTSLREIPNEEASGILTCSRDCALYAILLHEQPDYADMFDKEGNMIRKGFLRREGLDDAGIGALYDFVGTDGLEYGYALRKRLQETGKTLAQVYEERMGVPFTFKENYFRATFDRNSTKEKDVLTEPKMGSIGGGKYGLLIDRVIHSENLDFSKAGTLVFLAAAAEQDNYIYTSHITTAWRGLLKNKVLEQKLKQNLGEDMMGKLSSWMDLIDGASLENNRAFLNLSRMQGILQKAFAVSVLAGNGYVLLKQSSAILHGFFSGWVPSAVLERADGTRELAHRHISFADYLFHLAASKMGLGDISLKAVMASPYFQARVQREGAMLAQIGNQMPGQRYSQMEKLPEKAMDLIEWVDVKANLLAMHALANAYYAKAKALNEANVSPFTDAQLRESALEQVGMTLELGAQPLTKTQKSMNQAAGGILSRLAFIMKSEQLNKIGLMAAQWKTGSARNRVCAAQSWLALGVTSSLLAWLIAWIKGMDDDDDKEKKWKKYAASTLLGDLTTIPLAGEGVNYLSSLFTGEPIFADSYARTLIDVQGAARTVKKEYEHLADKKEMDWDQHFNNLTSLARAAGVGGAFSRSPSAVLSSYGALSLSAATGANISRTAKDLLTRLFGPPEEDRKKKQKKRKRKSEKKKMER